jgi:hypothetical protein
MEPTKKERHNGVITYHVGHRSGKINTAAATPETRYESGSWISTIGAQWLERIWRPAPFLSSRSLYVLFWAIPAAVFGLTWLLAYLVAR